MRLAYRRDEKRELTQAIGGHVLTLANNCSSVVEFGKALLVEAHWQLLVWR